MAARNSTTRKRARRVQKIRKPPDPAKNPATVAQRLASRKPAIGLRTAADVLRDVRGPINARARKPAEAREDELFAILHVLVKAISLIRTAKRSIEQREAEWDEIVTLEAAIKALRRVDVALNDVADGRPSRITADEDKDTDDREVGHD
jgi:hypothetical protein